MKNRKAPEQKRRRSHGRKVFIGLTLGALLFALCPCAHAQQQAKIPKIGWLSARRASPSGQEIIVRMLCDLGYVEGKNVAFEYRFADDKLDRLPALAVELVRLKVDVLLTPGTPGALARKKAIWTIPIVFFDVTDPVAGGLVDSLARPGGNITGFSSIAVRENLAHLREHKSTVGIRDRMATAEEYFASVDLNRYLAMEEDLLRPFKRCEPSG